MLAAEALEESASTPISLRRRVEENIFVPEGAVFMDHGELEEFYMTGDASLCFGIQIDHTSLRMALCLGRRWYRAGCYRIDGMRLISEPLEEPPQRFVRTSPFPENEPRAAVNGEHFCEVHSAADYFKWQGRCLLPTWRPTHIIFREYLRCVGYPPPEICEEDGRPILIETIESTFTSNGRTAVVGIILGPAMSGLGFDLVRQCGVRFFDGSDWITTVSERFLAGLLRLNSDSDAFQAILMHLEDRLEDFLAKSPVIGAISDMYTRRTNSALQRPCFHIVYDEFCTRPIVEQ
eukprot:1201887-Prymnesium_polylepis.1